jgi:hypothetical protein
MLRRVALVRTDVSEERSASFIRVTRKGELRTTLAVTGVRRLLVTATVVPISQIPPKRRFLQEPHGVTSKKTQFFMYLFLFTFKKMAFITFKICYINLM